MEADTYSLPSMSQSPKEEADVLTDMINSMIHARTGSEKGRGHKEGTEVSIPRSLLLRAKFLV